MSSVSSDNSSSECRNDILTETDVSNEGNVKPSSPSGMWVLMKILFILGVEYIYWWCGFWLFFLSIMIIFYVIYDLWCQLILFWSGLWLSLYFFVYMWYIFYLLIIQRVISQRENQQFKVKKKWIFWRCAWVTVFDLRKSE